MKLISKSKKLWTYNHGGVVLTGTIDEILIMRGV